jgi:hypothetical protein
VAFDRVIAGAQLLGVLRVEVLRVGSPAQRGDIAGPLGIRFSGRALPRLETGEIAGYDLPTPSRVRRKRPEIPSRTIWGMKATISSWFMKGKRELGVVFAGGDRYRRSVGLRS